MATVVPDRWSSDMSGRSRRDRGGCTYEAYVPDVLAHRTIRFDADVAADVADAEVAIARFDAEAASLVDTESLARILLRAESVASSRIEGLEIGARRLLRAEAMRGLGEETSDVTASEVLGNIDAMAFAVEQVGIDTSITSDTILDVHKRLLQGTKLEGHGGSLRTVQNWIGGSDFNPCSAVFIPAPPDRVHYLFHDLVEFCNDETLPAVAQAAIAHAQFETIHPFVDGNGRAGRALIHMILRRRGLARRILPPVSLVLATWAQDYVAGLMGTRYLGSPDTQSAMDGLNRWVGRFAAACQRAVVDAAGFERDAAAIEQEWRDTMGRVRANSAVDLLLRRLVGAPVVTVNSAAALIKRSFVNTNDAISRLVEVGILKQVNAGRRNRAFEAPDIIAAFTDLERQLASPEGDTHSSQPSRIVPPRRPE